MMPADRFCSFADHLAWNAQNPILRADRRLAEAAPSAGGSCAPCSRAVRFTEGRCDCPDRLDMADRALLHVALAEAELCRWSRLHVIGTGAVIDRLAALAGEVVTEEADIVACKNPDLDHAAARRALVRGGCMIAAIAFDPAARSGRGPGPFSIGPFGWDVLDHARAAGFSSAEILRPWSRELGYLRPLFFLKAVA